MSLNREKGNRNQKKIKAEHLISPACPAFTNSIIISNILGDKVYQSIFFNSSGNTLSPSILEIIMLLVKAGQAGLN
jgi:hypothetical protein